MIAYLPSPADNAIHIGPLQLRAYGLMIAIGVLVAIWLCRHRWAARGHDPEDIVRIAYWAVPGGLIGARLYSVATDFNRLYVHNLVGTLEIWKGGLGIPGGVIGGVAAGAYAVKRMKLPFRPLLDMVAPCLPLAQAIGRFGNYFNQELFGRPTTLPWGLEIDPAHVLSNAGPKYLGFSTFQPCFAYEALFNVVLVVLLVVVDRYRGREPGWVLAYFYAFLGVVVGLDLYLVVQRQTHVTNPVAVALFVGGSLAGAALWWATSRVGRAGPLRWGDLFALYVTGYASIRLWVESLRIDSANHFFGLRLNEWSALIVIVAGLAFITVRRMRSQAVIATPPGVILFDLPGAGRPVVPGQVGRPAATGGDGPSRAAGRNLDGGAPGAADPDGDGDDAEPSSPTASAAPGGRTTASAGEIAKEPRATPNS